MEIGPGEAAQRLHRDDKNFHTDHQIDRTKTRHVLGTETGLGVSVPGVDTRVDNGATRVIPGSHLWRMDRILQMDKCAHTEMCIREVFVMLGSVYHGGGSNSTVDEKRPLHGLFFCQGILKTEVCFQILGAIATLHLRSAERIKGEADLEMIGKLLFDEFKRKCSFLVA